MDPFEVLGLRSDASPAEIRRAFASGVRAAHPDVGGSAASASARLGELIQARDAALLGPATPPLRTGRIVAYQRVRGLPRLVDLLVAGLGWGRRPKPPSRHLR